MTVDHLTDSAAPVAARSRFTLWHLSVLLVVAALLISGYISYTELTDTAIVCAETDTLNCDVVQSSAYSKMFGIPIAYLGFGMNVLLLALLLLEKRIALLAEYGPVIVFGIVLFGFVYSMWLVYLQAARLEAYCVWCLSHAAVITVLFVVSAIRSWRTVFG